MFHLVEEVAQKDMLIITNVTMAAMLGAAKAILPSRVATSTN